MFIIQDGRKLHNLLKENEKLSQSHFPELIYRLIRATCSSNTMTHFPFGDAVFTHGVDGSISNVEKDYLYVPKGDSIWEIGSNEISSKKIISDYNKRKNSKKILNKDEKTFVLVTSDLIDSDTKENLAKTLSDEKIFKKVLIYDANDLVVWLSNHVDVSLWLLKVFGKNVNNFGALLITDMWQSISDSKQGSLNPDLFICGNDAISKKFIEDLKSKDGGVFSFSSKYFGRNHAFYFVIASLIKLDDQKLLSRTIIVKDADTFDLINKDSKNKIILIDFSLTDNSFVPNPLNTIIFFDNPLFSSVSLGMTDRDAFRDKLLQSNIEEKDADNIAFLSGYNPVVLRRLLSNVPSVKAPSWARDKNKYYLIPLLLLNEIDMDNQHSLNSFLKVITKSQDDVLLQYNALSELDDPPLFKYNHIYKVACRFEGFKYVMVDTFLTCIKNTNALLKELLFDKNQNRDNEKIIKNIIDGYVLLSNQSQDNKFYFNRLLSCIFSECIGSFDKTKLIAPFYSCLSELSPSAYLNYCKRAIKEDSLCLKQLRLTEKTFSYSSTLSFDFLLGLRYCLRESDIAYEAMKCLLDYYYNIDNSEEAQKEVIRLLSPVSYLSDQIAIAHPLVVDYFFNIASGKNVADSTPIIKSLMVGGTDNIIINDHLSYKTHKKVSFSCSFEDVVMMKKRAFNWLMLNCEDKSSFIGDIFFNIHSTPQNVMIDQFKELLGKKSSLNPEEQMLVRIKSIDTREAILKFDNWSYCNYCIPYLNDIIAEYEPSELIDKYSYILTDDFFPLDNPPKFNSESHIEKERNLRDEKRKVVVKELHDCYGDNLVHTIISKHSDNINLGWSYIFNISNNHLKDVDELVAANWANGLANYLSFLKDDELMSCYSKYSDNDVFIKSLPFKESIIKKISENKKEKLFWESKYCYSEYLDDKSIVNKFLLFSPIKLLDVYAFDKEIDYETGIVLLKKIKEMLSSEEDRNLLLNKTYEVQTIVTNLDNRFYTDVLSELEFNLLGLLIERGTDYPLGVKKYSWDRPNEFAEYLLEIGNSDDISKPGTANFVIYCDATINVLNKCFIPSEYLIFKKEDVINWVTQMLSKCNFDANKTGSRLIVSAILSSLSACPKIPGQDVWPIREVADCLELISRIVKDNFSDIATSFSVQYQNRIGFRTRKNGDTEFSKKEEFISYSNKYANTHPVTSKALKLIADDYEIEGNLDKRNFDLGE